MMYGISEDEIERIETELTSLCIRGMSLDENSPEHADIKNSIRAWHDKYDPVFNQSIDIDVKDAIKITPV